MRTLIGGALRAVVVMALTVASLRLSVWLVDGNDPSADADIGIGLVPIGVAAVVCFVGSWFDARRGVAARVRLRWLVAAVVCTIAVMVRGLDDPAGALVVAVVVFALVEGSALAGVTFATALGGQADRAVSPPAHGPR